MPGHFVTGYVTWDVPDNPGALQVVNSMGNALFRTDYT
jgi:hypothetical protein